MPPVLSKLVASACAAVVVIGMACHSRKRRRRRRDLDEAVDSTSANKRRLHAGDQKQLDKCTHSHHDTIGALPYANIGVGVRRHERLNCT
jgi:hypothetical protein